MIRLGVAIAVLTLAVFAHWQLLFATRAAGTAVAPTLAMFPNQLGDWIAISELPLAPDIVQAIGVDAVLSRRYLYVPSGILAEIFLGYFKSQTAVMMAERAPHLPTICLPAAGWTIVEQTALGAGTANLLRISSGRERRDVLFWHQTSTHVFANPLWSRWYGPVDQWRLGRNDLLMIRVLLPDASPDEVDLQVKIENAIKSWFSSSSSGGHKL
jgi:EpsI family protein